MDLRAGRIRDPIHGYVTFTGIERVFLDHPVAQRLRWVAQSGLAHYVFPAVRTSRFEHSLGTMHLASRFLRSAVLNTGSELRAELAKGLTETVRDVAGGLLPDAAQVIDSYTAQGLRCGDAITDEARAPLLLAEQGLRLAALFHDLGHLPFSHDFEYALGRVLAQLGDKATDGRKHVFSQGNDGLAIHEKIGYRLASAIFHERHPQFRDRQGGRAAEIAFLIAEKILQTRPPNDPKLAPAGTLTGDAVWGALHTLMAGELDVDRCDYLLRDARSYGFESATYDLDRLADNLVFVRPHGDQAYLAVAIRPQGVAAAESLIFARYRAYQWGPRHHKVAQVAAALQHTIGLVLRPVIATPASIRNSTSSSSIWSGSPATSTGSSARTIPSSLSGSLRTTMCGGSECCVASRRPGATDGQPWSCLGNAAPVSLWKRSDRFPVDVVAFNKALPDQRDAEGLAPWQDAVDSMAPGILVMRHDFKPWKPELREKGRRTTPEHSALHVLTDKGSLVSLTSLSALTASLRHVWERDVQVQAFALQDVAILPFMSRRNSRQRPPQLQETAHER